MGNPLLNMKEQWKNNAGLEVGPEGTHWHFSKDLDPRIKLMHEAAAQLLQEALEKPNLTIAERQGIQAILDSDVAIGHGASNWSVPFANSQQRWIAYPTQDAAKGHNSDYRYVQEVALPLILSELSHMLHGTRYLLTDQNMRPAQVKFDLDWVSHGFAGKDGIIQTNLDHMKSAEWVAQNKKDIQTYGHYDYDYEYLNVWRTNALAKAIIGPRAEMQHTYTGLPHGPDSLDELITGRYAKLAHEKHLTHSGLNGAISHLDLPANDMTAPIKAYLASKPDLHPHMENLYALLDQNSIKHLESLENSQTLNL